MQLVHHGRKRVAHDCRKWVVHLRVLFDMCQLGNGKGKVTRHFFLEGLRNLLLHHHVERMRTQSGITDAEWEDMLSLAL